MVDRSTNLPRLVTGNCGAVEVEGDEGVVAAVVKHVGGSTPPDLVVGQLMDVCELQQSRCASPCLRFFVIRTLCYRQGGRAGGWYRRGARGGGLGCAFARA